MHRFSFLFMGFIVRDAYVFMGSTLKLMRRIVG